LFHWHFKPITSLQAFDTFIIYLQACVPQQCSNPTTAISIVPAHQLDHISDQAFFVSKPLWQSTLCGAVLIQNTTNPSFRNLELTTYKINAGTAARRAQKFPDAASFKINLSSVRSETAHRRRSFSFFSRFSALSCSVPIPAYFFFQG
jgi:hypothetical protein